MVWFLPFFITKNQRSMFIETFINGKTFEHKTCIFHKTRKVSWKSYSFSKGFDLKQKPVFFYRKERKPFYRYNMSLTHPKDDI